MQGGALNGRQKHMHRFSRSAGALAAVAAVSALTMAGCGSGGKNAGGAGTTVTTAATSSTSRPNNASNPTGASSPASASGSSSTAAAPSTTASSLAGASNRSVCPGLVEKLVELRGAATGNTFSDLVATNDGAATCTLPAQPELQYLDARHQPLPVTFSSNPQLKPYNLAPGASAVTVVAYGSDGDYLCVPIGYIRLASFNDELAVTGRRHCEHDTYYVEGWVAGTYSAPH